jgi:hypothetical protein
MKEFEKLKKQNVKLRKKLYKLLSTYMMSEEVIDAEILVDEIVENEIQQEELCTG